MSSSSWPGSIALVPAVPSGVGPHAAGAEREMSPVTSLGLLSLGEESRAQRAFKYQSAIATRPGLPL